MNEHIFRTLFALLFSLVLRAGRGGSTNKHFTQPLLLPPLAKIDPATPYGDSIPAVYTNDPTSVALWLEEHITKSGLTTVGWDVESTPDTPWLKVDFKGPAVVQLSVLDAALVLQLVQGDNVPRQDTTSLLLDVMANPSILLTGVGLDQDILELTRHWGPDVMATASVCGRFDMGGIGGKLGQTVSIKTLAKAVLGVELVKSRKIAISNWGKVPLSIPQIAYAARDAWTAAAVLHELAQRDPSTYSTESLLKLVGAQELPLLELDQRAVDRKKAKLKYLDIVGKGDDKRRRQDLSEDERNQVDKLEAILKELAPPRPFEFDVGSLGLEL